MTFLYNYKKITLKYKGGKINKFLSKIKLTKNCARAPTRTGDLIDVNDAL